MTMCTENFRTRFNRLLHLGQLTVTLRYKRIAQSRLKDQTEYQLTRKNRSLAIPTDYRVKVDEKLDKYLDFS